MAQIGGQGAWGAGASTDWIRPSPPSTVQGYFRYRENENTTSGELTFTKTVYIGYESPPGFGGVFYLFYLYIARDSTGRMPGFYYRRAKASGDFYYYKNYSTFGMKHYQDVLAEYALSPRPSTAPTNVSASTSATFVNSINADVLSAKSSLQKIKEIAALPFTGTADFAEKVTKSLQAQGYTPSEIAAYLRARDDKELGFVKRTAEARVTAALNRLFGSTSTGGGGGSSRGSGGGSSNASNEGANFAPISYPTIQTRLVVRMPSGFSVPQASDLAKFTQPALHQAFVDMNGNRFSYDFVFDYIPSNIQYSGLGSEWVEIPRSENYPFVDWSRYQLMRVSMSFIIAEDRSEAGGAVVHDGIYNSVDSKITTLRRMAQRKYPVTIVNMDDLLSVELRVDQEGEQIRSVKGMQFVISDLSFTAARRTADPKTGHATTPSKIAVAQCQMTLQEVPIESVQIISLPALKIPFTPPKTSKSAANPLAPSYPLLSDVTQPVPNRSYVTEPPI